MFVLVRWEPIIHDDYPWIIPFWVQLTGMPLHLWTVKNLRNIGGRLGHVDTVEMSKGRMLIDIDSRNPLKFSRKIQAPTGEEVSIHIKYDMLFKHCSNCGLLSHEKSYCPSLDIPHEGDSSSRPNVFARVQLDNGKLDHQSDRSMKTHGSLQASSERFNRREEYQEGRTYLSHKDRVMRHRDVHSRKRYGTRDAPYERRPNERRPEHLWRPKLSKVSKRVPDKIADESQVSSRQDLSHNDHVSSVSERREELSCEEADVSDVPSSKRLASKIVTPLRFSTSSEDNVTIRDKGVARSLSFTSKDATVLNSEDRDEQMIEALDGMDSDNVHLNNMDSEMVDFAEHEDDLLGPELLELEQRSSRVETSEKRKGTTKARVGARSGVPSGILSKKSSFLRRGSPCRKADRDMEKLKKYPRLDGDNLKGDGLMGSNNPSKNQK
ncbi:hypothetical protein N665_0217s0014 [Sinapis alba]|nr:hypothetical protein N665_0217s0014 [Sinapis alba]